jgi:hypothetical protein
LFLTPKEKSRVTGSSDFGGSPLLAKEARNGAPGELKITARFPEGTVEINQFAAVKTARED